MSDASLPDFNDRADRPLPGPDDGKPSYAPQSGHTVGASTIYRLCEEVIALREKNERQHRVFEQKLKETRDAMQAGFNSFAGDTQRAYQQLRQEIHGEKRVGLALLGELLEISSDLRHIVSFCRSLLFGGSRSRPSTRGPRRRIC